VLVAEDKKREERSENMAKKKKGGLKEKSAQYTKKDKD
jgi:hypothetical protein